MTITIKENAVYIATKWVGKVQVDEVNIIKNLVSVSYLTEEKSRSKNTTIELVQWAIDRGDLVLERTGSEIDLWMLDKCKEVFKKCFGLQSALNGEDILRVTAAIDSTAHHTGFSKKYLWSILPTLKTLV